jgi:hypothetical protein
MPATECSRRRATSVPVRDGKGRPGERQTLLTAEPLDLGYEHEIRRVHQERDQAQRPGRNEVSAAA